jgi:aminoglycoside phosphotransferase family enzyme/predicted kinase
LGKEKIDLSSIEQRRSACLEEDRIARRLAPDVILGVVPVTAGPQGELCIEGRGETIDWALQMRRLPNAHRADHRLAAGTLTADHLRAVAHRLAAFHELSRGRATRSADPLLEQLRDLVVLRIGALEGRRNSQLPREVERIEKWQLQFLSAQSQRFLRRARTDANREGHGELALEHIFLDDEGGVRILAGVEMSPRLRQVDVAADLALLATDLAARHRVDLAERFIAEYARMANDFDLYPLLDFHASLRASLRAKLDWFASKSLSPDAATAARYRERARRFFALALGASRRPLVPPVVVAMGGQVASGKSTVARHIAERIGAPVVGSDPTRDFLLGGRLNEELHEVRWEESYERGFSGRIYDEILRRAEAVLSSGRPVVIDGCFRFREQRIRARDLAQSFERPFLFVETEVTEDIQFERLARRAKRDSVPLESWKVIADDLRAQWEPADELSSGEYLVLNTAIPLDRNAELIEDMLPTWPAKLTG